MNLGALFAQMQTKNYGKRFWNSRAGHYFWVFCVIQKLYVIPILFLVTVVSGMVFIGTYGNGATIHVNTSHSPMVWVTPAASESPPK